MLRKAVKERPVIRPTIAAPRRESKDSSQEPPPVLRRTSRFRADDEADDNGHIYPTARYPTRFD